MTKEQKTPFNPSQRAIARVKDVLPIPTTCRYCGAGVEVLSHEQVYGRNYSDWPWMYRCANAKCGACVGMHPFTNLPLGTLADGALRTSRSEVKTLFLNLSKEKGWSREVSYGKLTIALGIPRSEAHFGWFEIPTLVKVGRWAREQFANTDQSAMT